MNQCTIHPSFSQLWGWVRYRALRGSPRTVAGLLILDPAEKKIETSEKETKLVTYLLSARKRLVGVVASLDGSREQDEETPVPSGYEQTMSITTKIRNN